MNKNQGNGHDKSAGGKRKLRSLSGSTIRTIPA